MSRQFHLVQQTKHLEEGRRATACFYDPCDGWLASRGARVAKRGSLSLKRQRGSGLLARTVGTEYHILGTFGAEPVLASVGVGGC